MAGLEGERVEITAGSMEGSLGTVTRHDGDAYVNVKVDSGALVKTVRSKVEPVEEADDGE